VDTSFPEEWIFEGMIMVVEPLGNETHLHMDINGVKIMSKSEGKKIFKPNEKIKLHMNLNEMHLFDAKTTEVIY
jgi:multiple sugar transport system ATP-binding protein